MGSPQGLTGNFRSGPKGKKEKSYQNQPPASPIPHPQALSRPQDGWGPSAGASQGLISRQRKLSEITPLLPTPTPAESPGAGCGEPQVCVWGGEGDLNSKAEKFWWVGTVSWNWS